VKSNENSFVENLKVFIDIRSITMLFLGFSAGLPLLMIFSSLGLWLREAGIEKSSVTYFSWAALGYSFKFIWAPLVDKLPIPILSKLLGRRRSWLILSQLMIMVSILIMAFTNPALGGDSLLFMALGAALLGFSAATQDIVIDAFRIESADPKMQATLAATYIAGYRIGMLTSGAGALFIAAYFGTSMGAYSYTAWRNTYIIMSLFMLVGVGITLIRPEPTVENSKNIHSTKDYATLFFMFLIIAGSFIATFYFTSEITASASKSLKDIVHNKALAGLIVGTIRLASAILVAFSISLFIGKTKVVNTDMVEEGYINPIRNFFQRYGNSFAILLLSLIGLYRISDIVLGVISNVFYQDLGFTKIQIASVVKTFGLIMSLLGGFLGGALTTRFGVIRLLFWGAVLSAATNLLFMLLAQMGNNLPMLYLVISADNLAAGLASAAFVAFLSSLTDVSFTAVQYAIFTSLMTLLPKVIGGYSGTIVDTVGYSWFFAMTAIIGLPVLYIVILCGKKFKLNESQDSNEIYAED